MTEGLACASSDSARRLECLQQIINETRVPHVLELPLDSMGDAEFGGLDSQEIEAEILAAAPESGVPQKKPRAPRGLPAYLASLYEIPLLSQEQEAHLFRKMNYLKFSARRLRDELDKEQPEACLLEQIETLYNKSVATRNDIIRANLRLAVSITKRYVGRAETFFELVSDANLWLIRAVEKFDVTRGYRFCTYATATIVKNFNRAISAVFDERARFVTGHSGVLNAIESFRAEPHRLESVRHWRESCVQRVLCCLDERELHIIRGRFGLSRSQGPLTLGQLGSELGISKERIRQIQRQAIVKLRNAAEDGQIELTDYLALLPTVRQERR